MTLSESIPISRSPEKKNANALSQTPTGPTEELSTLAVRADDRTPSDPGAAVGSLDSGPSTALSVVISTLNRCDSLKRCVDALLSVTTERQWEIIVVDNGSTDGTRDYLASINQKQFGRVTVTATFESKRGLAAARNKGWRIAKGRIIGFTDDDCYVSKEYVDALIQVFDEEPRTGFLAGRIMLFDPLDYKITIKESPDRCDFRPWTFIPAGSVSGANMAFRRIVLEQIRGFDERLGAGTPYPCEDIDAAAAALWSGVIGVYDPRPTVYHHHGRRTERDVLELMQSYDEGRGAYYVKYILKNKSRWKYLRAWLRNIAGECIGPIRRGHFPTMQQSRRELSSGLRFALQHSTNS